MKKHNHKLRRTKEYLSMDCYVFSIECKCKGCKFLITGFSKEECEKQLTKGRSSKIKQGKDYMDIDKFVEDIKTWDMGSEQTVRYFERKMDKFIGEKIRGELKQIIIEDIPHQYQDRLLEILD